jgi:hypothetical protein
MRSKRIIPHEYDTRRITGLRILGILKGVALRLLCELRVLVRYDWIGIFSHRQRAGGRARACMHVCKAYRRIKFREADLL